MPNESRGKCMRVRLIVAVLLSGVFTVARSGSAAPVLDQSWLASPSFGAYAVVSQNTVAQTFTVGLAGLLTSIDVAAYASTGETDPVTIGVYSTLSGLPAGSALFSTSVNPSV